MEYVAAERLSLPLFLSIVYVYILVSKGRCIPYCEM